MAISRREFLQSLGLGAAAVAFGGVSLETAPASVPTMTIAADFNATLCVGDVFTISGYHAFNPITRAATGHLQEFVVTAITGQTVSMSPHLSRHVDRDEIRRLAAWDGTKPLHSK